MVIINIALFQCGDRLWTSEAGPRAEKVNK